MLFSTIMEIYGDWRRYNAGLSELSSLSDRELADIGISVPTSTESLGKKPARPSEPAGTRRDRWNTPTIGCFSTINGRLDDAVDLG